MGQSGRHEDSIDAGDTVCPALAVLLATTAAADTPPSASAHRQPGERPRREGGHYSNLVPDIERILLI
jgi:hypothetical protein